MTVIEATSREHWAHLASQWFVPLSIDAAPEMFAGAIDQRAAGSARLARVSASPSRVLRTPSLIGRSSDDDLLLSIRLAGTNVVSQNGRDARVGVGEAVLYASGAPYVLDLREPGTEIVLQVPRESIGISRARAAGLTARTVSATDPRLRILRSFLTALMAEDDWELDQDAIGSAAINLFGTFLGALATDAPAPSNRDGRLPAFKASVRRRLSDPRLDVQSLAREHGVSARTVHSDFAELGVTPALYIRGERIARAAERLYRTDETVMAIALASGFSDVSTFTRAFRAHLGQTPAAYRSDRRARPTYLQKSPHPIAV